MPAIYIPPKGCTNSIPRKVINGYEIFIDRFGSKFTRPIGSNLPFEFDASQTWFKNYGLINSKFNSKVCPCSLLVKDLFEAKKALDIKNSHLVNTLGRGSSGRTMALTLEEQLAMEQVMSNPKGIKLNTKITDKRWPEEGWVKMAQNVNDIEIHYIQNERLGLYDDFKFKKIMKI